MHTFLRSIGFSDENITEYDMDQLLEGISTQYDHMESVLQDSRAASYVELTKATGPDIGLKVCGELDGRGFHRTVYYPYLRGQGITSGESIAVQKSADGASFIGNCDDGRCAVPLIFYVQNPGDYRRELKLGRIDSAYLETTFSALALSGMVILPADAGAENPEERQKWNEERSKTVSAAKKGDAGAMRTLTVQDLELYEMMQRRSKEEDVLSIVETSLVPYGMETTLYRMMGIIQETQIVTNIVTDENIWQIMVECNGLSFRVCVNEKDLVGEPLPGRRFRGTVWLQGKLNFRFPSAVSK